MRPQPGQARPQHRVFAFVLFRVEPLVKGRADPNRYRSSNVRTSPPRPPLLVLEIALQGLPQHQRSGPQSLTPATAFSRG